MKMPTFGSLFAGIGGMDLGLERAGFECLWQVEVDDYATRVLERHWPQVQRFRDIRTVKHPPRVDLICGGFPCQDISNAGPKIGINGARSGLWSEFARIIGEIRPTFVLVENVSALLGRGLGRVLGDLAALGYDAEWHCLQAANFGAPHIRDRLFVLGYTDENRKPTSPIDDEAPGVPPNVTNAPNGRNEGRVRRFISNQEWGAEGNFWADSQPSVGRVADGIPQRMDRLRGLGNAVVPQIAEWIGRQIISQYPCYI